MKIANCIVGVSALLLVVAPVSVYAQQDREYAPLMVSRDAGGAINKESRKAIRQLSKTAKKNGHVRIWVTLDTPFDPSLAQKSEQLANHQQERVDELFDEVLDPLLSGGQVQYPTGEREYMGPSILLKVTNTGLRRLIRDQRVGQLVGVRE